MSTRRSTIRTLVVISLAIGIVVVAMRLSRRLFEHYAACARSLGQARPKHRP